MAGNFTTISNGDFTNDAIWNSPPPANTCSPNGNHTYNISDSIWTNCAGPLSFSGTVTVNILSGGVFYIGGNGAVSGNVTLNVSVGGKVVVTGDLSLAGSSNTNINGSLTVNGNITGSATFDCNGNLNTGNVLIGGTGCSSCSSGSSACNQNVSLPVIFNSIFANYNSNQNNCVIKWQTSSEISCDYFEIEKSEDGKNFKLLANIKSHSNSSNISKYEYVDSESTESITYYYRIKQVSFDGSYSYSNIFSITIQNQLLDLKICPNPASCNNFKISVDFSEPSPTLLIVLDVYGNLLFSKTITDGNNVIHAIEIGSSLVPGIYHITASSDNSKINKTLIIY